MSSFRPSYILESLIHSCSDPDLLRFIQSKRKGTKVVTPKIDESPCQTMETDLSSIELLSHPNVHTWPHFDVVESEKLEWMKDIANNLPKLKPGQSYEARFDWKGVLLPYFSPETDGDRELFLHETDAQRPGYTLQELFRLARSVSGVDFHNKIFVKLTNWISVSDRMSSNNAAQPSVQFPEF